MGSKATFHCGAAVVVVVSVAAETSDDGISDVEADRASVEGDTPSEATE